MFAIGPKLYGKRLEKGMTQQELVKKTGIPQPNLSRIEKGRQDITLTTFLKLCTALDVKPAELLEAPSFGRRKSLSFSRTAVERMASGAVHRKAKLGAEEQSVVRNLAILVPGLHKKRPSEREITRAWMALRSRLAGDEIKILTERIQDEIARNR